MDARILQVNFALDGMTPAEYDRACRDFAPPVAAVPGLRWKVWLLNEGERRAGGIYLFDDARALRDFAAGPIVAQLRSAPFVRDLEVREFGVLPEHSAVTRAPLATVPAAA
jgi:hypothetical protein